MYTAVVSEDRPHTIGVFETNIEIINGISSAPKISYGSTDLDLGHAARLIDMKFLNASVLLVLCQQGNEPPYLICIPFRQAPVAMQNLAFPEDLSVFAPLRMEVLGPNDAKAGVPARVALLGKDLVSQKVFALRGEKELFAV